MINANDKKSEPEIPWKRICFDLSVNLQYKPSETAATTNCSRLFPIIYLRRQMKWGRKSTQIKEFNRSWFHLLDKSVQYGEFSADWWNVYEKLKRN